MVGRTITLPDIGDIADAPVSEVHVGPGDIVAINDPLVMVETDKTAVEVPSPVAGKVSKVLVAVGTRVSMGAPLVIVEENRRQTPPSVVDDTISKRPHPEIDRASLDKPPATGRMDGSRASSIVEQDAEMGAHASPSVRAFARELGVSLANVRASGPKGRILRDDIAALVKSQLDGSSGSSRPGEGASLPRPNVDYSQFGAVSRSQLTRIQTISGNKLARNWATIPHVTNFDEADITDLEAFRRTINEGEEGQGTKLTMLAFMVKASAVALKAFPRFNSSLDGNELILKEYCHIGFAVDTPSGLLVPVVRDCDRKSLLEIARDISSLSNRARANALTAVDLQGGCFSISSLGGVGGTNFTPIINAPEVAILGAARSTTKPVWDGEAFRPRIVQPLSLSWDHRVLDGVAAAKFLGLIAGVLADFRRASL